MLIVPIAATAPAVSKPGAGVADPYADYRVRVVVGGKIVAGFTTLTTGTATPGPAPTGNGPGATKGDGRTKYDGITMQTGVTKDPQFGSWAATPAPNAANGGPNKFDTITLERGITQDQQFGQWAGTAPPASGSSTMDVTIALADGAGHLTQQLTGVKCRIAHASSATARAGAPNAVALDHLVLDCDSVK